MSTSELRAPISPGEPAPDFVLPAVDAPARCRLPTTVAELRCCSP